MYWKCAKTYWDRRSDIYHLHQNVHRSFKNFFFLNETIKINTLGILIQSAFLLNQSNLHYGVKSFEDHFVLMTKQCTAGRI